MKVIFGSKTDGGMELNFIMDKEQLRNYLESCAGMKK